MPDASPRSELPQRPGLPTDLPRRPSSQPAQGSGSPSGLPARPGLPRRTPGAAAAWLAKDPTDAAEPDGQVAPDAGPSGMNEVQADEVQADEVQADEPADEQAAAAPVAATHVADDPVGEQVTAGLSERLRTVLDDLVGRVTDLEAVAVISASGLPMAATSSFGFDEERVGAMAAGLLGLGERAARGLGRGSLRQVHVEGERGTVSLLAAGADAAVVAIAPSGLRVGLVLFELRHAAAAVARLLSGDDSSTGETHPPLPRTAAAPQIAPRPPYAQGPSMHPTGRPLARWAAETW